MIRLSPLGQPTTRAPRPSGFLMRRTIPAEQADEHGRPLPDYAYLRGGAGYGSWGLVPAAYGDVTPDAAITAGMGALGLAVGQARAVSGLPITLEEAGRNIYTYGSGTKDFAATGKGLAEAVIQARNALADQMRQTAADVGSNLSEVVQGYETAARKYLTEGQILAQAASRITGLPIADLANQARQYALVRAGEVIHELGVVDWMRRTAAEIGDPLVRLGTEVWGKLSGYLGMTSSAAGPYGALVQCAVSIFSQIAQVVTMVMKPPPPEVAPEHWGQVVLSLYSWEDRGPERPSFDLCPSWDWTKERYSPVFDPILREWMAQRTDESTPKRVIDVWGREKLLGEKYRRWVKRERDMNKCWILGLAYNNPSHWQPNDSTRMRGLRPHWYCAHEDKHGYYCDGTARWNNLCVPASQAGCGFGALDDTWLLRGVAVAAAYLGANFSGVQSFGQYEPPNCGYGSGALVPSAFWDLGIGGDEVARKSNWWARVLITGQVLLRPPITMSQADWARWERVRKDTGSGDRPAFLALGSWYPMFPISAGDAHFAEDYNEGNKPVGGRWYLDVKWEQRAPLSTENGVATRTPAPTTTITGPASGRGLQIMRRTGAVRAMELFPKVGVSVGGKAATATVLKRDPLTMRTAVKMPVGASLPAVINGKRYACDCVKDGDDVRCTCR